MTRDELEFEKPVREIEERIERLRSFGGEEDPEVQEEIHRLTRKAEQMLRRIYGQLSAWEKTQVARHPARPNTLDYIQFLLDDFVELHGDRHFADDPAIVAGLGRMGDLSLVVMGHQKGKTTRERIYRNFGMPNPEGYRKALRLMELAERFGKPILIFIDTPGAYPGVGAEERGQAEAIARNLLVMSQLRVPIVCVVIGEGGSGGALALGVGDRVYMLEHAIYSVISPEGCAAILWGDGTRAPEAAEALQMTAQDLERLGVIDGIIPEPPGGAHRDLQRTAEAVGEVVRQAFQELLALDPEERRARRYEKYRRMGVWGESAQGA